MAQPPDSSRAQDGAPDGIRPLAVLQPDKVVASRKGDVLIKYTILKSDHFPGVQWPGLSSFDMIQVKSLPSVPCKNIISLATRRLPEQEAPAAA